VPFDAQTGGRLREERERLGLSQQKVADGVGVRREMWAKYEAGAEPGAAVLAAAAALGINVLYVLTGKPHGADVADGDPAWFAASEQQPGAIDLELMRRVYRFLNEQALLFGKEVEEPLKVEMAVRVYNYLIEERGQGEVRDRKIERIARLVVSN
jgi:transcriptional regulator with XRE-family HTH domain